MSEPPTSIQPASVPLSHKTADASPKPPRTRGTGFGLLPAGLLLGTLIVVGALSLWNFAPGASSTAEQVASGSMNTSVDPAPAPTPGPDGRATAKRDDGQPAPFAATQIELARKAAQAALATFVERQIELKQKLDVDSWGQAAFGAALATASAGDELFVAERFAEAQAKYEAAAAALGELVERSGDQVERLLAEGSTALDARQPVAAQQAFAQALAITPDDDRALAGQARAARLPEVIELERMARNQGLAGDWTAAFATYEQIQGLDPELSGLGEALAEARSAVLDQQLRDALSEGFSALENRQYQTARSAFNRALKLEPDNAVARGGLSEIESATVVSRLAQLKRQAATAFAAEDWDAALKHYDEALGLDGNIAFAREGKPKAEAQQRIASILDRIISNPQKLSSDKLLADGRVQLERAQSLAPQGGKLKERIAQVSTLLRIYATPVPVRLTSDNRTDILVSSVGELGRFEAKQLTLRPGEYTLLGSRAGCRDVRHTIVVRPDMAPVDIRCQEEL